MNKAALALLLICTAAFAQQKGTFTDSRDKKKYQTLGINGLTWMAENLSYNAKGSKCTPEEKLNEKVLCLKGDAIVFECLNIDCLEWRETSDFEDFCKTYKPLTAKQIQDKKKEAQASCIKNGREYYDVADRTTLCPAGWHLPNDKEWDILNRAIRDGMADEHGFGSLSSRSSYIRCVQGKSSEEALAEVEKKVAAEKEAAEKASSEKAAGKQFNPKIKYGSMTDARDKTTYKTVVIGTQTWLAENLNYKAEGSRCYKDKDYFCKSDGRLYDWTTAKTACPAGWHLPTNGEWTALENVAGGNKTAAAKLKAASGWFHSSPYVKDNLSGTDDFGFSAVPTGSGDLTRDFSPARNHTGAWWSASEVRSFMAFRRIDDSGSLLAREGPKTLLYSVRCLQGEAPKEEAPVAAPAAPASNSSKPMYCVSYVTGKPVSCRELKDTQDGKAYCDQQSKGMKMMLGEAKWTATKPSIKCDK